MKKTVSIVILCSIFLTHFFSQEVRATAGYRILSSIHVGHNQNSAHNFHKNPVIAGVSDEVKDPKHRFVNHSDLFDFIQSSFCLYGIKKELKNYSFSSERNIKETSLAIFLANRSILI